MPSSYGCTFCINGIIRTNKYLFQKYPIGLRKKVVSSSLWNMCLDARDIQLLLWHVQNVVEMWPKMHVLFQITGDTGQNFHENFKKFFSESQKLPYFYFFQCHCTLLTYGAGRENMATKQKYVCFICTLSKSLFLYYFVLVFVESGLGQILITKLN